MQKTEDTGEQFGLRGGTERQIKADRESREGL